MTRKRKLDNPVKLTVSIDQEMRGQLWDYAFGKHESMSEITRKALSEYLMKRTVKGIYVKYRER